MTEQAAAEKRRYRVYLLAIFAVGLALRLLYVAYSALPPPDTDGYAGIASNVAAGKGFSLTPGQPTAYRPPSYPLFIALFVAMTGKTAAAIWAQAILQALTVLLAAYLARNLIGDLFALVTAALTAMDPYLLACCSRLMTECFYSVMVVASVAAFVWALRARSPMKYAVAGVLTGATALTRPEFLVFVPGAVFVAAIKGQRRSKALYLVVFVVASALLPGAWGLRNKRAMGEWIFTTTHGGYTHRLAYNEVFYGEVVAGPAPVWEADSLAEWQARLEAETLGMSEVERDKYHYAAGNQFARQDPARAAQIAAYEMVGFWRAVPHTATGAAGALLGVFFLVTAGLAAVGAYVSWRKRPTAVLIVYLLAAETLVHAWYWSDVRMRVPFHPLLAVLAAAGLATLFGRKIRIAQPVAAPQDNALYSPAA